MSRICAMPAPWVRNEPAAQDSPPCSPSPVNSETLPGTRVGVRSGSPDQSSTANPTSLAPARAESQATSRTRSPRQPRLGMLVAVGSGGAATAGALESTLPVTAMVAASPPSRLRRFPTVKSELLIDDVRARCVERSRDDTSLVTDYIGHLLAGKREPGATPWRRTGSQTGAARGGGEGRPPPACVHGTEARPD